MTETWRCFVAVPLGERLRDQLAAATSAWQAEEGAPDLRWTDPGSWHVTVAFLGAVEPDRLAGVVDAIRGAASVHGPFVVASEGVGAFPRPRAARVVWYGLTDGDGRFVAVAADLAARLGLEAAPFHPHLTLARTRGARAADLRDWLAGLVAPRLTLAVDELVLYRSHVGRGPAGYDILVRTPLVAAAVMA